MGQKTEFEKCYGKILERSFTSLLTHPFTCVKILVQVGYEPLPPVPKKTIFGRTRMMLPGAFTYMSYIKERDGFFGLYRGLPYELANIVLSETILYTAFYPIDKKLVEKFKIDPLLKTEEMDFKMLVRRLTRESCIRTVQIVISLPLHVIAIRSISQFVGRETVYSNIFTAVNDIYSREGIRGFFSGFVPLLIGDIVYIWSTQLAIFVIIRNEDIVGKALLKTFIQYIGSALIAPFKLVSDVMAVNSCSTVKASLIEPQFVDWVDCWRHFSSMNQLKRGTSLFFRYQTTPIYRAAS